MQERERKHLQNLKLVVDLPSTSQRASPRYYLLSEPRHKLVVMRSSPVSCFQNLHYYFFSTVEVLLSSLLRKSWIFLFTIQFLFTSCRKVVYHSLPIYNRLRNISCPFALLLTSLNFFHDHFCFPLLRWIVFKILDALGANSYLFSY